MSIKVSISCAVGDPSISSTWSRTPLNIIEELKKQNNFDRHFNTTVNQKLSSLIEMLSNTNKGDLKFFNNKIHRKVPFILLNIQNKFNKSRNILHMGILDVSEKPQKSINHYCYIDSTWSQWFQNQQISPKHSLETIKKIEKIEYNRLKSINHIFVTSLYVKEYIQDHYGISPDKITAVGTGTGIIQPLLEEKNYSNKEILFVAKGRFEDKGGDLVIKIFKILNILDPTIKLTILGQESYKDKLKDIPNLTVLGFISKEELQSVFNKSTIFLMPAKNEPWGLVYLEALLCKMPIMGLNQNSFPELSNYGKFGIIIHKELPNEIAKKIINLIEDQELLKSIGISGQRFVNENYRWDIVVKKMVKIISENQ